MGTKFKMSTVLCVVVWNVSHCIQFEKLFEYLRKTTEFWVYATTHKGLSCYFTKQRYLASQKNINSIGPFSDPPIYSTTVHYMWRKKYW